MKRTIASIIATAVAAAPLAAQAHPGHGELLHIHPELWLVIVVLATAISYWRRRVVA